MSLAALRLRRKAAAAIDLMGDASRAYL